MRFNRSEGVGLFCLMLILPLMIGAGPAWAGAPPDPLGERVAFLRAEVQQMRREHALSADAQSRILGGNAIELYSLPDVAA